MWRYAPLLPVANRTPSCRSAKHDSPGSRPPSGGALGLKDLWIKDEGVNPAASIQARGFSCAVRWRWNAASAR